MPPTAASRSLSASAFRLVFAADMVSLFGSLVSRVALPFVAILFLQARPFEVALLSVADIVAGFASALLIAPWIDRWPKRRTMLCADIARAALLAAVPLGAWAGWLAMPGLLAIALVCGVLNIGFELAYSALLPRLVDRDQLLAANSRIAAGQAVVETASFGLGGWLVQWLTAPVAVWADALSYVGSALLIWRVRVDEDRAASPADSASSGAAAWLAETLAGLAIVRRDPVLRALAAVEFCVAGGFQMYGAMFLLFVARDIGFAPGVLGMIFALGGLSSFAGALLGERLARRASAGPLMMGGLALATLAMFLPPLVVGAGVAGAALLIAQQLVGDGGHTVYLVNDNVLRQSRAPKQALARVNAGIRFIGLAAMLLGALAGALVGEAWGARSALLVAAAWASLGVVVVLSSRLRSVAIA
jgi:predicted MFS family arabinose efflux permease